MIIQMENLTKKYGAKTVLNIREAILNLKGATGIIGPNGAGKSTLINILAGLTDATLSCQANDNKKDGKNNTVQLKTSVLFLFPN